jgi:2-dehydro-3-deoxyphosphogluconate aldolase/(4S)-4-hydroxy-2-oxoglutarate aldolase
MTPTTPTSDTTPTNGPTNAADRSTASDSPQDSALTTIAADRILAVVRAPQIPDPAELCAALASGGIRAVEFTFTTPNLPEVLAAAAASRAPGQHIGAGTVVTAEQAAAAIDAGAEFLVTPAVRPEVAAVAERRGIPVFLGAFTPTEVMQAIDLGAAAVKIFPASALGPRYLKDLHGPLPDVRLVPSGGVSSTNARAFLDHGAFAVCCGTEVVPPATVAAGSHADIAHLAARFVAAALGEPAE